MILFRSDVEKAREGNEPAWLVLNRNMNGGNICYYNVYEHPTIVNLCKEAVEKKMRFTTFSAELHSRVMYEFWARCQWEMGVCDKFPYITLEELERLNKRHAEDPDYRVINVDIRGLTAVDVANQLEMNWDAFARYTFKYRKEIIAASARRYEGFMAKVAAHRNSLPK